MTLWAILSENRFILNFFFALGKNSFQFENIPIFPSSLFAYSNFNFESSLYDSAPKRVISISDPMSKGRRSTVERKCVIFAVKISFFPYIISEKKYVRLQIASVQLGFFAITWYRSLFRYPCLIYFNLVRNFIETV